MPRTGRTPRRLQAQLQILQAVAIASALQPMQVFMEVDIPADTLTTLDDLLIAQIRLRERLRADTQSSPKRDALQSHPGAGESDGRAGRSHLPSSTAQLCKARSSGRKPCRAVRIADLCKFRRPSPIPANASSTMQAFLALRQVRSSSVSGSIGMSMSAPVPARRDSAMRQWEQQNASQFQQLRQLAQNLSNSTGNNQ